MQPKSKNMLILKQMASKIKTFTGDNKVILLFFILFSFFSFSVAANEPDGHVKDTVKKKVNMAEIAIEHVLDSHSWHLWGDEHPVSLPLPVILKTNNGLVIFSSSAFEHDIHGKVVVEKNGERFVNFEEDIYYATDVANEHGQYLDLQVDAKGKEHPANSQPLDFSITKNVAQLLFSALLLIWLFTSIARSYRKTGIDSAPKGKQSFFEPLIVFVRDDIAKSNIGGDKYEKYVPYLLTVFFLILINNVLGLIPISANLTGNIAFTFVLATISFLVTSFSANKQYWGHIFFPPAPKALYPILIPLEILSIFTKPFALMIRLFANMTAGHIIVISLVGLIFTFQTIFVSPVAVGFALFIDLLECLVALLQAYIFTLLTALFIGSAMVEHHHEESHEGEHSAAHH